MAETAVIRPPTAATMRLDGGHPALELVNTIYGQVGGPVEHDVLATPEDLVTLTRRLGVAGAATPPDPAAVSAARRLRDALDPVLRALLDGAAVPTDSRRVVEAAAQAAVAAAELAPPAAGGAIRGLEWTWTDTDPHAPVHRLALAAVDLVGDAGALDRLRCCVDCCWLFLDRSRGRTRRWCSMADCGTEAKKRRYVEKRRASRRAGSA